MISIEKTSFTIGDLAIQSGCKAETVRYYEKAGLMPDPPRSEGGHRIYSLDHLKRMFFIRRSRELGFPIEQVKELLLFIDEPNHACGEVHSMAMLQALNIQEKINDLKKLQAALNRMAVQCKGGDYSVEDCPIVDALFKTQSTKQHT